MSSTKADSTLAGPEHYAGEPGLPAGPEAAEGRMTAAMACRACGLEPREGARFYDPWGSLIAPATGPAS